MVNAPELPTEADEFEESDSVKYQSPQPPRGRGDEFVARWRSYARLMFDTGILHDQFMPALEMLCDAHQQMLEADETLTKDGRYLTSEKGTMMAHPACVRRETAAANVLKYQKELCLTPTTSGRRPTIKAVTQVESATR